jgi:isoamylase
LSGEAGLTHLTQRGEQELDDTFLLIVNASHEPATQRLPAGSDGPRWQTLIDTAAEAIEEEAGHLASGEEIELPGRSATLLIRRRDL